MGKLLLKLLRFSNKMNDEVSGYGKHNLGLMSLRVLYGDTDKMGIVYHANYFRWFEAGRGHYMRTRGLSYTVTEQSGFQLPLVEAGIRYHKPATYEDIITIQTHVEKISAVVVRFKYKIFKESNLLVTGFTRHAAINSAGRPVRVPDPLVIALNSKQTVFESPL